MDENIKNIKKKLESEKTLLEKEISSVGTKNPSVPGDWEPKADKLNVSPADKNEMADTMENFEENAATEGTLEERLGRVNEALKKIADGTYGKCKVCGKEIEEERLSANPAALTCLTHLNS